MRCVVLSVLVALLYAPAAFGAFGDVVSSFPVPAKTGHRGLAWDGSYLWFAGNPYNYIISTTTLGSIISSFKTRESLPSEIRGLTFDGEYLWYSAPLPMAGYCYRRLTTTGSEVAVFGAGYGDPGLAWEPPRYLWIGPFKVTTTGSLVASFKPPFYLGGDLAWYGHYLWTGGGTRYYHQLTTKGSVVASFLIPGGAGAGGTAFDGNYMWLVAAGNKCVYQIDIDVVGMNPGSMGKIKGLYR